MNKEESQQELVRKWQDKITRSEKIYDDYYKLIEETREFYKAGYKSNKLIDKSSYNIFWSSIETQKPFLYFLQPQPCVSRSSKSSNPIQALACKIMEKAIEWDLSQFDFDSVIKYARNDYLISGCGILWEQYKPTFKSILNEEEEAVEIKEDEVVISEYVDPKNFLADTDKVGIWEDLTWIAKRTFMTKEEVIRNFGEEVRPLIIVEDNEKEKNKEACIYEIWDKSKKKIYWMYKECTTQFLKVSEDFLHLPSFFPCPKPIFATLTNDSIIPRPDYAMIKTMLDELNGINTRMRLTMKALKVSGVYDNSFSKLADIFEKDVTLVSIGDFDKLKNAGGLKGVIDFLPIEQYVVALEQLARRREDVVQQIFDITGVSDIMRGNSNPNETATAVNKKTNFGTLRNQDRQNDMQRFICDLYCTKGNIICEQFSEEKLISFLNPDESVDSNIVSQAIALLKTEKMRGMSLKVETETVFNQEQEIKQTMDGVKAVSEMIQMAFGIVSQQPLLLPLYRQMISAVVATMPKARSFETAIETSFAAIEKQLNTPPEPTPPQQTPADQINAEKVKNQFEIDKEKNAIKEKEINMKEQEVMTKLELTNKEMDLQASLKDKEIEAKTPNVSSNITTGFVRGF